MASASRLPKKVTPHQSKRTRPLGTQTRRRSSGVVATRNTTRSRPVSKVRARRRNSNITRITFRTRRNKSLPRAPLASLSCQLTDRVKRRRRALQIRRIKPPRPESTPVAIGDLRRSQRISSHQKNLPIARMVKKSQRLARQQNRNQAKIWPWPGQRPTIAPMLDGSNLLPPT